MDDHLRPTMRPRTGKPQPSGAPNALQLRPAHGGSRPDFRLRPSKAGAHSLLASPKSVAGPRVREQLGRALSRPRGPRPRGTFFY